MIGAPSAMEKYMFTIDPTNKLSHTFFQTLEPVGWGDAGEKFVKALQSFLMVLML